MRLQGIIPALATPLTPDLEPDEAGFRRLVQYQLEGGVVGLFPCSSTGEGPMLSDENWARLLGWAISEANGRVPVLAHVTDVGLPRVLDRVRRAANLGADAVAAAAPYYYQHTDAEVLGFFENLADASPLPVFVYNIPQRVKTALRVEQLLALAPHPNIAGMKDSAANAVLHLELLRRVRERELDFTVLNGTEAYLGASVMMGGDGGLLGVANLAPRLCVQLYEAAARGDAAAVRELQPRLSELTGIFTVPGCSFAGNLKAALALLGLGGDTVLPPFGTPSPEARAAIRALLERHDLL